MLSTFSLDQSEFFRKITTLSLIFIKVYNIYLKRIHHAQIEPMIHRMKRMKILL